MLLNVRNGVVSCRSNATLLDGPLRAPMPVVRDDWHGFRKLLLEQPAPHEADGSGVPNQQECDSGGGVHSAAAIQGFSRTPPTAASRKHIVQRFFLTMVAVKSGSLPATQSTNLRTFGSASNPATSVPCRCSSELVKLTVSVCWQMGCMGTTSRPPRLLGMGWCQTMVLPVGRLQSQHSTASTGVSSWAGRCP